MPFKPYSHVQDYEPVVIYGRSSPTSSRKEEEKEKKKGSGRNEQGSKKDVSKRKLAEETDAQSHVKAGVRLGMAIQKARVAKKMTQAQLALALNENRRVVNQYESGKAIPTGQMIAKMERTLGTKLPRPSTK